ncbi:hypothetical protein [Pararhodobacter sp.]|uniref:hypothetical protein n=1 Tax=Pararhodobacter sp. TaxID=2127056 RepID=UPI002AFE7F24|nr:hypothetical protein [Pararhodobacter sp.]
MPPFLVRSFSAAAITVSIVVSPAVAQESAAKTAWQDLRSFARERGVLIASQGVTDYGTSLIAQNVRIYLEGEPDSAMIQMPELRIEPRGEALALIPSPDFYIVAQPDRTSQYRVTVSHSGEIVADVSQDRIAMEFPFDHLRVALTDAVSRGNDLDQFFSIDLRGLAGGFEILRSGEADLRLDADFAQYSLMFSDTSGSTPMRQNGSAEMTGLRVEFSASELDMISNDEGMLRTAFDAGFAIRLALGVDTSSSISDQLVDGSQIAFRSSTGANEMALDIADGALSAHTMVQAGQISGGMAPFVGEASFDEIGMSIGVPLLASPQDQTVSYRFNFDNVVASAATLQLVGAQDFAGEAISVALDVSAQARLTEDVGSEFGQGDTPPFDVSSVSLNRLLTRVGDAELTGSGAFTFLGGLMSSIGEDIPNGTGDFIFDLIGGDALLTRLSALGIVPNDQQFFARMMMNGLGRSVGEDHLQSEVSIRPGGQVTVNGAPLPF